MSVDSDDLQRKALRAHERLDEHEDVHQQFDRRISRNENWRLQAQGALKVLAMLIGTGAFAFVVQLLTGVI